MNFNFSNNVLWKDETKVELFDENQLPHSVRHGGGRVMIWAGFVATRPDLLLVIKSTTNSFVDQSALETYVSLSFQQLKLGPNCLDNTMISNPATNLREQLMKRITESISPRADLSLIEMCSDLSDQKLKSTSLNRSFIKHGGI